MSVKSISLRAQTYQPHRAPGSPWASMGAVGRIIRYALAMLGILAHATYHCDAPRAGYLRMT